MARTTERPRGAPVAVAAALHGGVLPERSRSNNRAVHERHRGLPSLRRRPSLTPTGTRMNAPNGFFNRLWHGAPRVQARFCAFVNHPLIRHGITPEP